MKDVVLKVEGMSCGHCVRAVDQALRAVPGASVRKVEIGAAEVQLDDAVPVGVLVDALADAGYTAEERT
jgi:copper chaperone